MPRLKISDQLELSTTNSSIIITDGTNEATYVPLDLGDFTVNTDINNNGMSFTDIIAGNAPAITPTPPAAPPIPANNATLIRKYDDKVRYWKRVAGVWSHVFDTAAKTATFVAFDIVHDEVAVPVGGPFFWGTHFIVPTMLNGAIITEFKASCYAGVGITAVNLRINGIPPPCIGLALVNAAVSTDVCVFGTVVNTDDIITVDFSGNFGTTQLGLSTTIGFLY